MSVEISIETARRYIAAFLGTGRVDAGAVAQPRLRRRLGVRRATSR